MDIYIKQGGNHMLSLKENMLRVYRHQEPEYTPLFSDFNSAMPGGMDFINERPDIPGENLDLGRKDPCRQSHSR